jgi:hypothetical protein
MLKADWQKAAGRAVSVHEKEMQGTQRDICA